ncbi:class I SAM-dependent methyltransferase [Caproicibacterium sp. XB2]|uniref:class I SAM-dependent methyltransferase n=1 Tax=Caproicibacterium sp. XB2 TaxID=3388458 RepID=UPI00384BBAC0
MRNEQGFDEWAETYDESVSKNEQEESYPFAGYHTVLQTIYKTVTTGKAPAVLDIGFGTGVLTKKLYDAGCRISGIDFSRKMIDTAQPKMPKATLVQADFSKGVPPRLAGQTYDDIISTYAFHHLTDEQKAVFLRELLQTLNPGGRILIGDVMFPTDKERQACREKSGSTWDENEHYLDIASFTKQFPEASFHRISFCAGILTFTKDEK